VWLHRVRAKEGRASHTSSHKNCRMYLDEGLIRRPRSTNLFSNPFRPIRAEADLICRVNLHALSLGHACPAHPFDFPTFYPSFLDDTDCHETCLHEPRDLGSFSRRLGSITVRLGLLSMASAGVGS